MNIEQAKKIPVENVLSKIGFNPKRIHQTDYWYLSPFTTSERTPSFKINTQKNRWYCHSNGFGGNTLDFVVKYMNCSVSEALNYLKDFSFSLQEQKEITPRIETDKNYKINLIKPLEHIALIKYLNSRGIFKSSILNQLREVHYQIEDRNYFAIAFKNKSDGYEIRSKFAKLSLGTKDITLITNNSETIKVFEGFFDYLSYLEIQNEKSDFLILNSLSLLDKNLNILKDYSKIELFLDNDSHGIQSTESILKSFINAIDNSYLYSDFKDLNEYLIEVL